MNLFPSVRLSELKNDVRLKKSRLDGSAAAVRSTFAEQAAPTNLLKHPTWLIGGIISTLATLKIGGKVVGFLAKSQLKGGIGGKIAAVGGAIVMKKVLPIAATAAIKAIESFVKKRS